MEELITARKEYRDYTNDLTREMDSYLCNHVDSFRTYIYDTPFNNTWAIRYPGATRGHIKLDENNIIKEIVLYKNYNSHTIYKDNIEECFSKYIGMKFIIKNK